MNIVVLGGSPKGEKSVTMQYVNYLKTIAPQHDFTEYYIAARISTIESDNALLEKIAEDIQKSDAVLWAFPLFFGLVHSSYKRFIELVFERGIAGAFKGKHCAILATSIHFFDNTAIEYIQGISEDLEMIVDEIHSAAMRDLMEQRGKNMCRLFLEQWVNKVEGNINIGRISRPIEQIQYSVSSCEDWGGVCRRGTKLGLVTESGISENLDNMVAVMTGEFAEVKIFDLSKMKIAGGCLGCLKCGYDNKCVYEGKDDVIETYRSLKNCDAIVFAGTIKDRYLSARWKTFTDRFFFTTHIPFFDKKVMGFIISGPLRQIPNLRQLLTGIFEVGGVTIGGIVTDEDGDDAIRQVRGLADTLESYHKSGYQQPRNFIGEAGHLIFRDAIFGGLKGVFVADHKYYKKNGLYDFPQKDRGKRFLTTLMYMAVKLPFVRKNIQQNMAEHMIRPYKNALKSDSE